MDSFTATLLAAAVLSLIYGFVSGAVGAVFRFIFRPARRSGTASGESAAARSATGAEQPAGAGVAATGTGANGDFIEANFSSGDRDTITGSPFEIGAPVFQCADCRAVYSPMGRLLIQQNNGDRCVRCGGGPFWQSTFLEPFASQPGRMGATEAAARAGRQPLEEPGTSEQNLPAPPNKTRRRRSGAGGSGRRVLVQIVRQGVFVAGILAVAAALYLNYDTPTIEEIREIVGKPTVEVWRENGELMFGEAVFPVPVEIDRVPEFLKSAIIEMEDRRFRYHFGIDPIGIVTAVSSYSWARINGQTVRMRGASTITQQVAKNLFLSSDRSLTRKARESWLAIKLNFALDKDDVLELYLNRVFLGGANYGVELAARDYFGVRARNINKYQAAMLAGIISRPNPANPRRNTREAHARARIVLAALADRGKISEAEREKLLTRWHGVPFSMLQTGTRSVPRIDSGWIQDWLLRELADARFVTGEPVRLALTIDPLAQVYSQLAARRLSAEGRGKANFDSLALVVLGSDGDIRALIGGADRRHNQFNNAVQAKRPMASTFKPLVYLSALAGGMMPETQILDEPIGLDGRDYPRNFTGRYQGAVSLADALSQSLNAAAVRLGDTARERRRIVALARRLGLEGPFPDEPSLALGTVVATPLQVATVYASFANGGYRVQPFAVAAAQGLNGRMVYQRDRRNRGASIATTDSIRKLNGVLNKAATRGTGRRSAFSSNVAGKTGTSQDSRDAWFAGYTKDLIAVIWVGNGDNSQTGDVTGGGLPASAFGNLMANIHDGRSPEPAPGAR